MSPPLPSPGRTRRLVALGLAIFAGLAIVVAPTPVDAHGDDSGAAARASATRFHAFITAYDIKQDGHCAVGRFHENGRWRVRATDCSHSPVGNGVGSNAVGASGWISASACIRGDGYNNSTCHYGGINVPFGRTNLGNVP